MIILGITGGVGAGKSTVLAYLETKYDARVLQADKLGHELIRRGQPCYQDVVALFGPSVLDADGEIIRSELSKLVYADPVLLEQLNQIIHPAVRKCILEEIRRECEKGRSLFVLEAALLLETGYREICSQIWYVYAEENIRIQRLMTDRGYTLEKSRSIIAAQQNDAYFRANTDQVIDNSYSLEETQKSIDTLLPLLLR